MITTHFDEVASNPEYEDVSRSTGNPVALGSTLSILTARGAGSGWQLDPRLLPYQRRFCAVQPPRVMLTVASARVTSTRLQTA